MDQFEDLEWDEIKTPIIVAELHKLLIMSDYDKDKTEKLITGYTALSTRDQELDKIHHKIYP